jgi:hypothetical protein
MYLPYRLHSFADYLANIQQHVETIFIFNEKQTARGWYPPTSELKIHPARLSATHNSHFQELRDVLMAASVTFLLACFRPPKEMVKVGVDLYLPLFRELYELNRGIIPIFTTNYDLSIEDIFAEAKKDSDLITAAEESSLPSFTITAHIPKGSPKNVSMKYPVRNVSHQPYLQLRRQQVALFHLHGCVNWFVDTKSGNVIQIDPRDDLEYILPLSWFNSGLIPANIVPAAVKDAYTISPPFDIGYDYFSQVITQSKILIIVGYSGRDDTLKEILLWGVNVNKECRFIVVGRGNNVSPHLLDVLPQNRVHYFGGGISDNVDAIAELCRSIVRD